MTSVLTASFVTPIKLDEMEIKMYKKQGFLVIPGLIDPQKVNAVRNEVLNNVRLACGSKSSKLAQTGQYTKDSLLDSMINSEEALSIVEQLLGGASTVYLPFSAVKSANGGGEFHFHQDNQYTTLDGPALNMWIAMNDMTPENGCLGICPGSHKAGTLESVESPDKDTHRTVNYKIEEFLPLRMRAGDAVVFDRLTVHGSGKNLTNRDRVAYAIQFNRNDVNARFQGETEFIPLSIRPRSNTKPVDAIKNLKESQED
jgi:2-oxoglutarate-dependent dioxygenase